MTIALLNTAMGEDNIGDQILFRLAAKHLYAKHKEDQVIVLSLKDFFKGEKVREADLYYIVGAAKVKTKDQEWKTIEQAKGKVVLFGVGSDGGSSFDEAQSKWFSEHLSKTEKHLTRDDETIELLNTINITNVQNKSCPSTWELENDQRELWLGYKVIISFSTPLEDLSFVKKQYDELSKVYDVTLFVQTNSDYELATKITDKVIKPDLVEYDKWLMNNEGSLYIGSRLHGAVEALTLGSSAIIISNGYKNAAALKGRNFRVVNYSEDMSYLDELAKVFHQ